MKRIKLVTEKIENEAHKNAEGFDITELCFNSIFHLLDDNGVFYNAINDIVKSKNPRDVEIELKGFKYGVVKESDNKLYPVVDMIISIKDSEVIDFVFSVTPFNASMESVELWDTYNGNCNKQLTEIWRTIMKGIFKDKWIEACELFSSVEDMNRMAKFGNQIENRNIKMDENYESEIESL